MQATEVIPWDYEPTLDEIISERIEDSWITYPGERCWDLQVRGRHFVRDCGAPGCPWQAPAQASWGPEAPDGSLSGDDDLSRAVASMWARGMDEARIRAEWDRLAHAADPSDPWTDRDFRRHLRGAVRKYSGARDAAIADRQWWEDLLAQLGTSADEVEQRQADDDLLALTPIGRQLRKAGITL